MDTKNNLMEIPLRRFQHLLVVDLEATCWPEGRGLREDMETIEFGAVLVRMADLTPIDERSWFVRPRLHPQLSPYCTDLTSITQADVDGGISFHQMSDRVIEWLAPHGERLGWGSWGNFDRGQLDKDAARLGTVSPLAAIPHVNLKELFGGQHGGKTRRPSMRRALNFCGLSLNGTHHRGIDDARNIARLLPWILDPKLKRSSNSNASPTRHARGAKVIEP